MDAKFGTGCQRLVILGSSLFFRFSMSLALRSRGFCLHLQTDIQSYRRARQWMKGLGFNVEYLKIFSCSKASSVVKYQLAEHGMLETRPGSVLCNVHVLPGRKSEWSSEPLETDAHVASGSYRVIACTVLCLN